MQYIDVIIPLPLHEAYTYSVPENTRHTIYEGSRVIVQFGKKKFYTAIVSKIYSSKQKTDSIKEITATLEDYPIVSSMQLKLWKWIASYYMCSLGDVYKAALPAALKLESETFVLLKEDFIPSNDLSQSEQKILMQLSASKPLKISEIEKSSGVNNAIPHIKSLVDKGAALLTEDITQSYTPKTVQAVQLAKEYTESDLNSILNGLQKAKKQYRLLLEFLCLKQQDIPVYKRQLLEAANSTTAHLNELVKKGILTIYEYQISRFDYGKTNIDAASTLNTYQQAAYDEIINLFKEKNITLLHGVTSSGKTEIYIRLLKDVIAKGKQALYLLPEIALTTQITNRLKAVFGNKLAVYHSKFNDNERAETWNNLINDSECQIVLGARSAIFLPFTNLDLIIVDEEHEASYKQQDPAPRYNARNAAIMLANMCGAKVLLGSATPSIETYYNALSGRYGLVKLTKRYEDIALPNIEIVNVKELRRTKQMKSTILSPPLINSMNNILGKGEQVILFQNRRGFSSMLECKTCSWTPRCNHCDVSLTYHKGAKVLICHYCGATYPVPSICPECQTETLTNLGYGTERIEEEVVATIPEAIVARMDLDTTRSKKAYERIISDFENNKTNVLIGTQMVSKGLDFDNVSIVGILNADNMLNYPDFRAHERAYQLMAQVSGRAGRKNKQGHVILQTSHPAHPIITFVKNNDYESFFRLQMEERKLFHYPPYYRLISIIVRGRDETITDLASKQFGQMLRQSFGERILGPTRPPVSRVQSLYIRKILLKVENQASIMQVRESILHHLHLLKENKDYRSILIHFDVDPM